MQIMNLTTLVYALMIISLICTAISLYQQAKKKREQEKEEYYEPPYDDIPINGDTPEE